MDKYTTSEKVASQSSLPEKEQTEKFKTILTNDAFALTEALQNLTAIMFRSLKNG